MDEQVEEVNAKQYTRMKLHKVSVLAKISWRQIVSYLEIKFYEQRKSVHLTCSLCIIPYLNNGGLRCCNFLLKTASRYPYFVTVECFGSSSSCCTSANRKTGRLRTSDPRETRFVYYFLMWRMHERLNNNCLQFYL